MQGPVCRQQLAVHLQHSPGAGSSRRRVEEGTAEIRDEIRDPISTPRHAGPAVLLTRFCLAHIN